MSWTSPLSLESIPMAPTAPNAVLKGKTVALIHPAWPLCGSHRVFVSQAKAYQALGAEVISLAVADFPGNTEGSKACEDYFTATQDLKADLRFYTGLPFRALLKPSFLSGAWQWLHGNYAAMRLESAHRVALPVVLTSPGLKIDLIHCNHFFCMPVARVLRGSRHCPIVLETHDVQARQYAAHGQSLPHLPPRATYEHMLSIELAEMQTADALIHLNDEEAQTFQKLLPDQIHSLIYPAVAPVPANAGGLDFVIVASDNYPNFRSIEWFLKEVLPLAKDVKVRIIGTIDQEFRKRTPRLFRANADLFEGVTNDLDQVYRDAAAILLPTIVGEGISIKTIEALSSGAPLVATTQAFRGMRIDTAALSNVLIANDAAGFADALRVIKARQNPAQTERSQSDTRHLYDRMFSFDVYRNKLGTFVLSLLDNSSERRRD